MRRPAQTRWIDIAPGFAGILALPTDKRWRQASGVQAAAKARRASAAAR